MHPDRRAAGKTVFLSTGASNAGGNLAQIEKVTQQVDYLKQHGATNVVIPGVGPGVPNSDAVNARLQVIAEQHGAVFFQPDVKWQADGVHPAEVDKLRQQAQAAIATSSPISAVNPTGARLPADTAGPLTSQEWLDDLAPDQRARITDLASKRGVSPQQFARGLYLTSIAKGEVAPPPDRKPSKELADAFAAVFAKYLGNGQAKPAGNYRLADLRSDPAAARALDFVSTPESGGNYNAYIGHPKSTVDLSQYNLNEIAAIQASLVARGYPSGAIGRYQFLRGTLLGLRKELGLSGDEKFTPELQDRLGVALLKRRGLDDFRAGQMSAHDFALGLAQEWAGLPHPDTGQSFYRGQRSGVSTGEVGQMLNSLTTHN